MHSIERCLWKADKIPEDIFVGAYFQIKMPITGLQFVGNKHIQVKL